MKMDAVNLQGVWPTFPEEEVIISTGGNAPQVGAFIYYLMDAEKRKKLKGKDVLEHAKRNRIESLDETIKRFEIRESTDFALLFAEA